MPNGITANYFLSGCPGFKCYLILKKPVEFGGYFFWA